MEKYKLGLGAKEGLVRQLTELQSNPGSLVFVSLAENYRREGMPKQALQIIEEGLAFHPGLASALIVKGRCLFDMRRYSEALAELGKVLKFNPENLKAHKLQAEIYIRLGQRKSALRALTHVVSLYPQDKEAVRALEELESAESQKKISLDFLHHASSDSLPLPQIHGKIEEFTVMGLKESLESIGIIDKSLSQNLLPEEEEEEPAFATRTIAELYLRQGLMPKAIKVLKKILKENPANEWARETLQELTTDGIVTRSKQEEKSPISPLEKKAKFLERLLAQVRLMKNAGI